MRLNSMPPLEQFAFPWADPPKPAAAATPQPARVRVLMPHPSSTYEEVLPAGTKWDFETSFPEPLPDAFLPIDDAYEMEEEAVAAVHEEHTRHCLGILRDICTVKDSIRTGVDPRTGKPPRTAKARGRLSQHLGQASKELAGEFEQMLDAYASAFGDEAQQAFRAYLLRRDREFASEPGEPVQAGA
jgi:hypothetical protein